jgi:hypothetical protein
LRKQLVVNGYEEVAVSSDHALEVGVFCRKNQIRSCKQ